MILIDETWNKIDDDMYYRQSPVQPKPDKFTYYQFVKLSIARILEVELPTMDNRKELERILLGNKCITRRNKLDEFIKNNPGFLCDYLFAAGKTNMEIFSNFPIYLRHPNGTICYERFMLSTDPGYRKGMQVISNIDDETIYMKHFDNVVYNATNKGYTRLDKTDALKPVIRQRKLETILK